ncbi:MAG: dihydrolipoamide acetyltransferase family protein, partial [Pyrinomonadaceae bacterium]
MPSNVIMPQMGESIFEGTVTKWLKKIGEPVKRDEPLFEISTDKVDSEIPAPASGILSEIRVKEGETVQVNTVVAVIAEEGAAIKTPEAVESAKQTSKGPKEEEQAEPSVPEPAESGKAEPARTTRSSPLVRRIAKEEQVDLNQLEGTGLGGRITKKDILSHLSDKQSSHAAHPPSRSAPAEMPEIQPGTDDHIEVVPMSAMRKSISEHMIASRRISAHVTTVFEVDMTRIVDLKNQYAQEFMNREGGKLSYMPFFIKVTAGALKEFPIVNASIVETNVLYKKDINIGVAVALDWGLIVPVIKNADEKSFLGIAKAASSLAERARQKKLAPEDVPGGTFTIPTP